MHKDLSIQNQTVKNKVLELLCPILVVVDHQLAIREGINMERLEGIIARKGEMETTHVAVLVLAINQVVDFGGFRFGVATGEVEETSDAVCLFADVVVVLLEFEEMAG